MKNVIVIGAGASGLIAAIYAKSKGNNVILLEKNEICGKKILATGNGRCNFWNEDQRLEHYRSSNFEKIEKIINNKNREEILKFFEKIGIEPKIKNGYYYPNSNQAISIKKALELEAQKQNVIIKTDSEVVDLKKEKDDFKVILKNGQEIISNSVILATGSKAAHKTGSDGIGYQICKKFNHTIVKPLPALVQLKADGKFLKDWEGIRTDVLVKLYENDKKIGEEIGEIQLTNYGISGICVFNLSGRVSRGLNDNKKETVKINFLNSLNINLPKDFIEWMNKRNLLVKDRSIFELLEGVLNYKLVNVLLKKSKINNNMKWEELSLSSKNDLSENITSFKLEIIGTNSFDKAQVCSGGIPLNEIDVNDMQSLKVKGLYIIGELLDVDGDCGGYNLEWAWITGMIAGSRV